MAEVDLRELRTFLVLAEELHFGRTADKLGLTTSRVSQTLRALERKLGGELLLERSSRRVTLTAAGRALVCDLAPVLDDLDGVVRVARARAAGPGLLRIGVLNAASGVDVLTRAVAVFEAANPGCTVELSTTPFDDRLAPLRRREVDLVVTRLPLNQPDIVVGPLLGHPDKRVVMLGRAHPLAARADICVDDLVGYVVRRPYGVPNELAEATCPSIAPCGEPIHFVDAPVADNAELLYLLARGEVIHPTVAPYSHHFRHPDVVARPLRDLPDSRCALAHLRSDHSEARDTFLDIVAKLAAAP